MSNTIEYKDLIAFHPGSYIEEIVDDLNITQAEFAERTEISGKTISKIINGEERITPTTANKLSKITGISIQTWLNLQANYDAKVAAITEEQDEDEIAVVEQIDFSYFKHHKLVPNKRYTIKEKVQALRKLLKTANLFHFTAFNELVSYRRMTPENELKSIINSNVMLELASNKARNVTSNKYDKTKLIAALPEIKEMNIQNPEIFYDKLTQTLLNCGIVLVALPKLTGAMLNGATKKFKNNSVLLLITDKNKYSDVFWFSLVHELGHIINNDFYSDYTDKEQYKTKEAKADKFASEFFISTQEYNNFVSDEIFTRDSITHFANKLNILPGIVVGRLQTDNIIQFDTLNELKTKYEIIL